MESPIGILKLISDERALQAVLFDTVKLNDSAKLPPILHLAQKQLEEYFLGYRQQFDFTIDPEGTNFQHLVWEKVLTVNFGSTKSYFDIARAVGSENSSRAIGLANGRNPIPIIIPCHRIIGKNGKMTGYAGGLERKKWLLLHEQKYSANGRLF